jgi:hypothetical protein
MINAINISNTETGKFFQEVTVLRNFGILVEIRTSASASFYVKSQKMKGRIIIKKDLPRSKISLS